jgi:hypothetical protein
MRGVAPKINHTSKMFCNFIRLPRNKSFTLDLQFVLTATKKETTKLKTRRAAPCGASFVLFRSSSRRALQESAPAR